MILVDCIVGLPQYQEDLVEDPLPHLHNFLQQLGYEIGVPHTLYLPETMNSSVLVYFCPNVDVNYPQYSLTEYLREPYSLEVSTPL